MRKIANWTKSSWDCFEQNCICSEKCPNFEVCQRIKLDSKMKEPPIKKCVEELIDNNIAIPLVVTDSIVNCMTEYNAKVLRLWVEHDMTEKEIAEKLGITINAVREHKKDIWSNYEYSVPNWNVCKTSARVFSVWAKENLVPELNRLEKVGVAC